MSGWNYAQLSKIAKANGGPEKLVNTIFKSGVEKGIVKGRLQMLLFIGLGVLGFWIKYFWDKQHTSVAELEAAKQELITGIKEYDATHNADENPEN